MEAWRNGIPVRLLQRLARHITSEGFMSRRIESGRALKSELVAAACVATGQTAEQVSEVIAPAVEHLQKQYGGGKLYVPKIGRKVSAAEVRRDLKNGLRQSQICRKYGISTRTFKMLIGS
jgi:long-subunit acyl-CoA synthetase (AMP-forming)